MIYIIYLCIVVGITFLSMKSADYVDWLDKKTTLSGAFIGGVMLSAVTSLPELFTSISSTLMLNEPGLCIGNILGSDLFNLTMLAILIILFINSFEKEKVAKGHFVVLVAIIISFAAILLNYLNVLNFQILTFNVTSLILLAAYIVSLKFLASEEGEQSDNADDIKLTVKQIVFRFIVVSIGIIGLSILLSYTTDNISEKMHLGKGLAGALFMGIATSLPEVTASISLFKKKNYNIAIGNIVGSNIFNLFILSFTDVIYAGKGIYDFSDPKTINLMSFGLAASVLMYISLKVKPKWLKVISGILIVGCYVGFLYI